MEILRVEDVGHKYQAENGEVTAFEHISFTVQKGEFMSIVGPVSYTHLPDPFQGAQRKNRALR